MGKLVAGVGAALVAGLAAGWLLRGSGSAVPGDASAVCPQAPSGGLVATEGSSAAGTSHVRAGGPAGAPGSASSVAEPREPLATDDENLPPALRKRSAAAADAVRLDMQARRIAELEDSLRRVETELAEVRRESGPSDLPEDATAADRRAAAARDGNMLVEFPYWGDPLGVTDDVAAKYGLTDQEREDLDRMYSDFYTRALAEMKRLYRELTGDPSAGESSSLNALLHNVIELSPPGTCRESMARALALLAAGLPIPPPGPDAPACEIAIYFIFGNVDDLEQAAAAMGQAARDALWNGRSTFQFSAESDREE